MPDQVFRFHKRELEQLFNGKQWRLQPGVHFPPSMPLKKIKDRLVSAAQKRDIGISVWFMDGNVHLLAAPWVSFRGGNPDGPS